MMLPALAEPREAPLGPVLLWLPPAPPFPWALSPPALSSPQAEKRSPCGVRIPSPVLEQLCGSGGGWEENGGGEGGPTVPPCPPMTCCPTQTGFFQEMYKSECLFLNGTKNVRFLEKYIYNREQRAHFDSDVGHFVADTPLGEPSAKYWNSQTEFLEDSRSAVDTYCRHNYKVVTPFTVERRGECVPELFPGGRAHAKPLCSQDGRNSLCRAWSCPRAKPLRPSTRTRVPRTLAGHVLRGTAGPGWGPARKVAPGLCQPPASSLSLSPS